MIDIDITKKIFTSEGEIDLDIKLNIKKGEFISIAGKSGSGKTTLLRVIAGLEKAQGIINAFGLIWTDSFKKIYLPPQKREIGFVFQDYALFPNMSVEKNLLFVSEDKELAKYLLDITNLYSLKNRYPNTLSGGQKQRVALARALMKKPKLLLLDEPLSAVDEDMREKLQEEILSLHKEFGTTSILVSHSYQEMKNLSDRILTIKNGKLN